MAQSTNGKSPNFLIIQVDQLAPQALPVHGHDLVKAPNIAALAAEGVVFDNTSDRPEMADTARTLLEAVLDGWDPDDINRRCLESQHRRLFVQRVTGGEPNWAYKVRPDDDTWFIRNAGGVTTKAKARFPFVESTPSER